MFKIKKSVAVAVSLAGTLVLAAPRADVNVFCPKPVEAEGSWDLRVPLDGAFAVSCNDPSAAEWVKRHAREWFGKEPKSVAFRLVEDKPGDESYTLTCDEKGVTIDAASLDGVRYAMYTLRQAAVPKRGTATVEGYIAPKLRVVDRPALGFRGMHFCWFPEYPKIQMEKRIRMAAYLKFNYVVIENWGAWRSETHPWYGWADGEMTADEIRRLVAIAKDLGVTLVPQLNIFGHATLSRGQSGKHAGLDVSPERQTLFEPVNGWNWCLTNPETLRVQKEMLKELWELFGRPAYVHLGCDEANPPSCPDCLAANWGELVAKHIGAMCDYAESLGAHPMLWQDMFLDAKDQRWRGWYAHGTPETAALVHTLPKNAIICDWYYEAPHDDYPTMKYFKELGFPAVTSPCYHEKGCAAQARFAVKHGIGYLATTWTYLYGGLLEDVFTRNAFAAWSACERPAGYEKDSKGRFMAQWRQVGWDAGVTNRLDTGVFSEQSPGRTQEYNGWRGGRTGGWLDHPWPWEKK